METRIGLPSERALAKASSPHGYQSTGLWACWSRYGLVSRARRLSLTALSWSAGEGQRAHRGRHHAVTHADADGGAGLGVLAADHRERDRAGQIDGARGARHGTDG